MPATESRSLPHEWHLISSEYPPQIGGVSDYASAVAAGLGATRQSVHVWCPAAAEGHPVAPGVTIHAELGRATPRDLRRVGRLLDRFAPPRRLFVQWVPHGYGYRSMNLPFCVWLWQRARRGDVVDVMVHEPFLRFEGSLRQRAAAVVHRAMMIVLLRAARRAWFSIPAWMDVCRPYTLGRRIPFGWLPIPSPASEVDDAAGVAAVRKRYAPDGIVLVGHFSAYGPLVRPLLKTVVCGLGERAPNLAVLLIGSGSLAARDEILREQPHLSGSVFATGSLSPADLSRHLQACDLLVQPYPDGVSTRRTTIMAALSHGKPTVTTAGDLTESLWRESGAVRLVNAGDGDAMVREVRRLAHDGCECARLGRLGRSLYDDRFDLRHTINALLAS